MQRKRNIILVAFLAVLVVAGLSFGLVRTYAQAQEELPSITPTALLEKVAGIPASNLSVSGDFTVTNDLLGPLSALSMGGSMGGGSSSLLQGGSGRLWIQDEQARIDIFGSVEGDTSIYAGNGTITVYDAAARSLTEYSLPAGSSDSEGGHAPDGSQKPVDIPATIAGMIEKIAPTAALDITGQGSVAGRLCYLLTLTPESDNSLFGSLTVAIDGETYVPLRAQVFGRGNAQPLFSAGFDSVSYDAIDEAIFVAPTPPGVELQKKELTLPFDKGGTAGDAGSLSDTAGLESTDLKPLTLAEAEAKAGFKLAALQGNETIYPFKAAYVIDLPQGDDLQKALSENGMLEGMSGGQSGADTPLGGAGLGLLGDFAGPLAVLVYGQGFDTVVLVETPLAPAQSMALQSLLGQVPLLGAVTVNGNAGFELSTALASLLAWHQDEVGVIAAGGIPAADLRDLAADVR